MKIAIYGSRRQDEHQQNLAKFFDIMNKHHVEIVMHRNLYDVLLHLMPTRLASVRKVVDGPGFEADAALSIGGDGTFLRTAMWVGDKQIPILGVNAGHLGYLSKASMDELPQVALELLSGEFEIENRSLLQAITPELNTWPYALNEAAVMKEASSSMIVADTQVDGAQLAAFRADGLLVCTPTGSTAYNLSVGGPIIQPSAPVWAISPIAGHALGMRPLVVGNNSNISITVDGRARSFRLALDGRACSLAIGTTVELRKAPFVVKLIGRPGHSFSESLREKLHWNE